MKPKPKHYYKYHTENIHIVFRLIKDDGFKQSIYIVRVYRTTKDTRDTFCFEIGKKYETLSMFDDFRVLGIKEVPKRLGKRMERVLSPRGGK